MIEFKFADFFYPGKLVRTYALLRRSEHWSLEQFDTYQMKRLAPLLRFCAQEVPYYASIFRQAGLKAQDISSDNARQCLSRLPLLDKDTVREQSDTLVARHVARFNPKPITTSGTTGTPLTVYWDRDSNVMEFCSIQRFWRWAGFRIGQSFLDLRSRVFTEEDNHLVREQGVLYIRNWKVNGIELSSDYIDERNIHQYYEVLLRYTPRLVRGHPQAIQHLVSLLQEKHLDSWCPAVVTPTSETLYEFQREQMESAWQVPVMDSYGLKEHNVFIAQCCAGGYHIYPEYGICEIVDDDGNPVQPGQEGWIVATGLHTYAQPLLRYNTRDRAVASHGRRCACGRTLPTVEHIVGRIDDCIYTHDGKRYSGMHFAFFGRRGIKKARLVQEDLSKVQVELVVTSEFAQAEQAALRDALERKVENRLTFEFRMVRDIVQENPGKFKFVVSRLKTEMRRNTPELN